MISKLTWQRLSLGFASLALCVACGSGDDESPGNGTGGSNANGGNHSAGTQGSNAGSGGTSPGASGSAGSAGSTGGASNGGSGGAAGGIPGNGNPPNLFIEYAGKTQAEVDEKVTTAVNRFFGIGTGEPNTLTAATGYRCYYELPQDPSLAFIWAPDSDDVRSEGMSYGMMIALQMDMQPQFDKLWKFAKTYMQYPANTPTSAWKYYFRWQGTVNDNNASSWQVTFNPTQVPAPDGDEYFAAALYLADQRWGSDGTVNYKAEADNIATAMLHNTPSADMRYPIFHTEEKKIVFVPYGDSYGFSDPSYHLPGFYELFAVFGPPADATLWREIATISREYLVQSAHPETGLHPDYARFDGTPTTGSAGDGHDTFRYDAWRVVMNMAVDFAWFSSHPAMQTQVNKYHAFFSRAGNLTTNNVSQSLWPLDGSTGSGGGSTALTATLAAGALASTHENRATFVNNLWAVQQQSGTYRYYQESVYLLGLLATAGKYRYLF